jgi:thioredoxin reductase
MLHYKYLLVGGGMTADSAARGIRSLDRDGTIGLIGAEPDAPYNRPPLSKGLWQGRPIDKIWRNTAALGVELHLGRTVTAVDVQGKTVTDDQGETYAYEKLLLATGGTPRRLPFGGDAIIYLRTVASYRRLRALADQKGHLAVIGSGFVGSEIAASLTTNGCRVTMIYPEQRIGERAFPAELSAYVTDYYRQKGVDLRPGQTLSGAEPRGQGVALLVKAADGSESELLVDGAVPGLASSPTWICPGRPAWRWKTGSWSIRPCRPACPASMRRATWPRSTILCWTSVCASSMKMRPTAWAWPPGRRWPARPSTTRSCPSSTRTCSTWATRPWVSWMRAWRRSPIGRNPCATA